VKPPIDVKPPVETSANFSVRNGRIYDPSGKEFQPRGVDVDDVRVAMQDIDLITKDWSANMIRLSPYNAKDGVPTYDKETLGKVVEEYTKRGVVVELTDGLRGRWGDILQGKELQDHANYYKEMAEQFKDNPYVWFATPNEAGAVIKPGSAQDKAWLNEEVTINKAIRDTGNKNIIVQGDATWGQGSTSGDQSALLRHADTLKKFGNMVAGQHVYNDRPDAEVLLDKSIDNLRDKGFAVLFDEVGDALWAGGNQPVKEQSAGADAVLDAVEDDGIGMLAFRWTEGNKNLAYNLTRDGRGRGARTSWGNKVWEMTHGD
jgi:Cellulase (glycosyl hydrolase family 5).